MKTLTSILAVVLLTASASFLISTTNAQVYHVNLLWTNPMGTNDIVVSKNGGYLAIVNDTDNGGALFFFAVDNSNPKWWWSTGKDRLMSVAISADGEEIITGSDTGYLYYFKDSTTRVGEQVSATWVSVDLGGSIERGTIDISDDGQYAVVGGTGEAVYYFADCTTRTGFSQPYTWHDYPASAYEIFAMDLSPDGRYIAAGGLTYNAKGFVAYYSDANQQPYPSQELWNARNDVDSPVAEVRVSDDGQSVVAVSYASITTLHYWNDATELTGDPSATWNSLSPYYCVDMSSSGNEVVAGKPSEAACGIHFWAQATQLSGEDRPETWAAHEGEFITDVTVSRGGKIVAAVSDPIRYQLKEYWVYFYKSDGTSIGQYQLDSISTMMSMSGDGGIVATGGSLIDSVYVFKITLEKSVGGTIDEPDHFGVLSPFLLTGAIAATGAIILIIVKRRIA